MLKYEFYMLHIRICMQILIIIKKLANLNETFCIFFIHNHYFKVELNLQFQKFNYILHIFNILLNILFFYEFLK